MATKPIQQVIPRWERFKRLLVWHPINTDPTDDNRWTVRVWLPLYDLLAILAGYVAFRVGSPLLNRLLTEDLINVVSAVFLLLGAITLVGLVVPKLWRVEIAGKIGMLFLMTTYAMLLLTFPSEGQNNSFVVVILIMATWGAYPRLTTLFIRGYRASVKRKQAAAARKLARA